VFLLLLDYVFQAITAENAGLPNPIGTIHIRNNLYARQIEVPDFSLSPHERPNPTGECNVTNLTRCLVTFRLGWDESLLGNDRRSHQCVSPLYRPRALAATQEWPQPQACKLFTAKKSRVPKPR
jgi:hypothetical protein